MALMTCRECSGPVSSNASACPKCGAKPPKRTTLFTKIIGGFFALLVVSAIFQGTGSNSSQPRPDATTAQSKAMSAEAAIAHRCGVERDQVLADVRKHVEAGENWKAHLAVRPCALAQPNDEQYVTLSTQTEVADYLFTITSKTAKWDERLRAHRQLASVDPKTAARYAAELQQLEARALRETKQEQQKFAAAKRKEGASIGMTKEDVLASSWGRPEKINTTTTIRGSREQWVYGGGYLYFDENILTAIQN